MISTQKKIWSEEEDTTLRKLYEQDGLRNWSLIAKKMAVEHFLPRKSAKQCRERYENHINMDVQKMEWTREEEQMLILYHNDIGNKWAAIATKIPGKNDNCVKNHFYSKLRKVLRKLNTIIHAYFRRQFREININIIYKIVEACEQRFKQRPNCDKSISLACQDIQNTMLSLSMLNEEQFDSQERVSIYRQVIKDIYSASKLYKRKSKKSRNSSIQAPTLKMKKKKEIILVSNSIEQGYVSDRSSSSQQVQGSLKPAEVLKQQYLEQQVSYIKTKPSTKQKNDIKKNDIIVKDEQQGIKDLLKEAGLLIEKKTDNEPANSQPFKFSSKSSFKSYSENNDSDQNFFEDSDIQKGFFSQRKRSYFRNLDDPSQKSQRQGPSDLFFN